MPNVVFIIKSNTVYYRNTLILCILAIGNVVTANDRFTLIIVSGEASLVSIEVFSQNYLDFLDLQGLLYCALPRRVYICTTDLCRYLYLFFKVEINQ